MGFLQILGLFGNIAITAVGSLAGLTPANEALIGSLLTGTTGLIGALAAGNTKLQDVLAALAGLSSIIAAIQADPAIKADPAKMNELNLLDGEVSAAIAGYIRAGKGYDLANYAPIAQVS